ncbi:hypothetical protein GCM10012320_18280 [Sinomonas cellulolyticus]|uniref:Dihydrofolate reductase family protein n=1 Tax=Sinomonas cellulolyticus TaxID=2801916 RepID=A0ABS1K6X0_9MICC|nr:dihydrofolate reductase family protein [Sinomonas cellulolyticus]GHG50043.1 hypothetical protein GCM10012320_18280 [Sinomonas sp. KCTC 49339]
MRGSGTVVTCYRTSCWGRTTAGTHPPFVGSTDRWSLLPLDGFADRAPIEFDNGTVFHFLSATPEEAPAKATEAAGGADVRIGGGVDTVREFLEAGLVDRLHVAISPILLGRGKSLWEDLRGLEAGYTVSSEVAESGVVHMTFARD